MSLRKLAHMNLKRKARRHSVVSLVFAPQQTTQGRNAAVAQDLFSVALVHAAPQPTAFHNSGQMQAAALLLIYVNERNSHANP